MATHDEDPIGNAHRTQSAVVRTLADELRRRPSEAKTVQDLRGQVLEESERLASTIRDLAQSRSARPPPSADRAPSTLPPPSSAEGRRPRVLIVEDDVEVRDGLARYLARDYDVLTACDGIEGLERATDSVPDLVISDVWMPNLDGIGMVRRIKGIDSLRHIPILFLTGQTEASSIAEGFSAGVHSYIAKPVDLDLLEDEIRAAIGATGP